MEKFGRIKRNWLFQSVFYKKKQQEMNDDLSICVLNYIREIKITRSCDQMVV